jgi:ribosome recycling factor
MDFLKKAVKDGLPEDAGKRKEDEVEKMVKQYYGQIDHIVETKEQDILTI